jgi:hypothetical protein
MKESIPGQHLSDASGATTSAADPVAPAGPQIGDYAVLASSWDYKVAGPLTKITAQKVFYSDIHRRRDAQAFKDAVIFVGPEAAALMLTEKLRSSRSLAEDEKRNAWIRHVERQRALLAKATDPEATSPSGGATCASAKANSGMNT